MLTKRSIFFLTAARSEYDILAPLIHAVQASPGLEAGVIVGAAQLSPFHGSGVHQIEADEVPIVAQIESLLASESWTGRSLSCAHLIQGLTQFLSSRRPDILVVAGDREEALAGALVGNFLRIPVAHLHGGDRCIASDVDEIFRPAISKLAHLHFTANDDHRDRLIKMGELPSRVWSVGATGLDRLRSTADADLEEITASYGINPEQPFFMVIYHPEPTLRRDTAGEDVRELLEGVLAQGIPVLCSYPNADPGNMAIRQVIDELDSRYEQLVVYHNLPRAHFVTLFRRCSAIVGNSSSIVIESGFVHVPGILVGSRQDLRTVGINVLRVAADRDSVSVACRKTLTNDVFLAEVAAAPSLYGDGFSSERIVEVLTGLDLAGDTDLLLKTMPY